MQYSKQNIDDIRRITSYHTSIGPTDSDGMADTGVSYMTWWLLQAYIAHNYSMLDVFAYSTTKTYWVRIHYIRDYTYTAEGYTINCTLYLMKCEDGYEGVTQLPS